jgi:CubicO group peptidase (beta-lactamase class C family)
MTMGGAGLASTLDDYMRFARMLLGRGALEGTRILSPDTIRVMSTDQLDPRITERSWLPGKGSVGFGVDFAVRVAPPKDAQENRGAVGEFFWDGAATTLFWVDPANDLAAVFFVQVMPFDGTLHHDIRQAVYGPDYTGPTA